MFPIAHAIFPLFLLSIYDKIKRAANKTRIPLHYFIILAFAGIFPDLLAPHLWAGGRQAFSHTIFFPLIFLALYFILKHVRPSYKNYAMLFFIGTSLHLLQDVIVAPLWPLYPLSVFELSHLIVFPAHGITLNGVVYANFIEHATWYLFDALAIILFLLSEKTSMVEKVHLKLTKLKK